jgi:ubiquitin-like protein Pup
MAGREQTHRHSHDEPEELPEPEAGTGSPQATSAGRDEETDDLLDEIDGVLESNAQDFVHSFVQKGGQ